MNMRLRLMGSMPERIDAACDALSWGYPREVPLQEVEASAWYRLGLGVVFWFHRVRGEPDGDVFVHLAVAPEARGHWPIADLAVLCRRFAELHGGTRLRYLRGEERDDDM